MKEVSNKMVSNSRLVRETHQGKNRKCNINNCCTLKNIVES